MPEVGASVLVIAKDEPPARLARLFDAVAAQDVEGGVELIFAVEPIAVPAVSGFGPRGAVLRVSIVENPGGNRSVGLNGASAVASSPWLCRLDARSQPSPDYVRRCVSRLRQDEQVGIVGGRQCPRPAGSSPLATGVARALSNRWLLGAPAYRRAGRSGPVDTVYLGAFRRGQLRDIGGFDERLEANEDFELAQRYRAAGWLVWLEADVAVSYEARASVGEVLRQYHSFGRSKVAFWRLRRRGPNVRQRVALASGVVPLLLVAGSARRAARVLQLSIAALAVLAVVDHVADPAERRLGVRFFSIAASAAILSGWLAGVGREALAGGGRWCVRRVAADGSSPR